MIMPPCIDKDFGKQAKNDDHSDDACPAKKSKELVVNYSVIQKIQRMFILEIQFKGWR